MCSIDCVIILRLVLNLGVRHARRSLARFSKNAHRGVIMVVEDVLAVAEGLSHADQVLKGVGAFAEGDLALLELVLATDSSKRMQSVLHAVFRVDRSPLLRSVGRVDMLEPLNDGLHRHRRPRGARNSPRPPRPETVDVRRGPVRPLPGLVRGLCDPRVQPRSRPPPRVDGPPQRAPWGSFRGSK